jgi:hypothetical protein
MTTIPVAQSQLSTKESARTTRPEIQLLLCCARTQSLVNYGVHIGIRVSESKIWEQLQDYLPPGWELSSSPSVDELYSLVISKSPSYHQLFRRQQELLRTRDLENIFEALDSDLRLQVAIKVKDKLFVHAGVVGWQGRAIIIPGRSFSGKTTLVAALVKIGATYYSDEYAVFDANGLVYPYPRRLSIRQAEGKRVQRCPVEELGGQSGTEPLSVGMVIHTHYQVGVQWCPNQISLGQAVLALLDNTVVARLRPEFALPILATAVSNALIFEGQRGEADETASLILKQLENSSLSKE